MNSDAKKILLTFVVFCKSARKNFFFLKFFQPIRIREKIKFNFSIFFTLESRDQWIVMLKRFYWPMLFSPNPREKFFFLSKFFDQSDFEKKSNSILRFFSHWNREMSEHWCWKISINLRCNLQIRQKNFFFLKFSQPIRIREKIKFNSTIFFTLESRDRWTVMLKKFHWPSLYSSNPPE